MTWHYQAFKCIPKKGNPYFCVKEVYPDVEGETLWTAHPIEPISEESHEDLMDTLKMMLKDVAEYPIKEEYLDE